MLRNILAVIVGYIVMAAVVMIGLTVAYLLVGADRAFRPGGYELTTLWLIIWFVDGVLAAVLGGIVCALISKHRMGAAISLAVLVLVLSVVTIAMQAAKPEPTPEQLVRTGETPNFEAMSSAQTPLWVALLNPVIGVAGVFAGAALVNPDRRNRSAS